MKKSSLSKVEKILRGVFLLLAVIMVGGILKLIQTDSAKPYVAVVEEEEQEQEAYDWEQGLSDETYWLPDNCRLYEELPDITFVDSNGKERSISEWKGKAVALVFWASWCEDCGKQMPEMKAYEELAGEYGDVEFLYINKTDGEKETKESAEAYFQSLGLQGELYFDSSLRAYDLLGVHNIPTTLFLNREGILTAWSVKQIEKASVFQALMENAWIGSAKVTADFVANHMMDQEGGIHSSYLPGEMRDGEVLSESQGLGLLYAVESQDQELFDRLLGYVKTKMWNRGLSAWRVEEDEPSEVNALIDDFRIYRALLGAHALWGGYQEEVASCESALLDRGISDRRYADFFDSKNTEYASRFTLCYGDLQGMALLSKRTGSAKAKDAYDHAAALLERGQISNEFPLYYSWYNYDRERYENDDLNTAEAMMTLLHLAREEKLKNNTVEWLKKQMAGEGVKARYDINGGVVKGYNYESTAVYAIIVMIADEIGDSTLKAQALNKMEKMHVIDKELPYNGAYGMEDGSGITSFDQLMPMLACEKIAPRE